MLETKKIPETVLERHPFMRLPIKVILKGFIYLAMADPQEFFKQHLIKKEKQTPYRKIYSVHCGEVSTM